MKDVVIKIGLVMGTALLVHELRAETMVGQGLAVAVAPCRTMDTVTSAQQNIAVGIRFALDEDAKPQAGSIELVGSDGGSAQDTNRVFDTARRAIVRCGPKGFPVSAETAADWQEIEMMFKPEGVFWR